MLENTAKPQSVIFPLSKIIAFLLCVVLLCIGVTHFPTNSLSWDVFGYYLYLPMTFIYHDLGLHTFSVIDAIVGTYHNTVTFYQATRMPSGDWVMRYNIGTSILYSPFFFIGHLMAKILGFPTDGFSVPYQYSIWSGCMIYTFIGIFMFRKSLLRFFDEGVVSFLLIIIVLGTNYTLHTSVHGQGAMTHNFLFTLYTFILWFTIKWHETYKIKHAVYLAAVCGLAVIVRPTELIGLLIPILWGIQNKKTFYEKLRLLKEKWIQVLLFIVLFTAICFIQLTYNKIYAGSFFYDGHYNPAEGLDFPPHTIKFLFSFRNGWLIYTPVVVFSFIGLYFLYKTNKKIFFSILAYAAVNLWIVSSWTIWWYGGCFGQRGMIASYPILALPMGYFLNELWRKSNMLKYSVFGIIIFFVLLNLFQTWQMANGILASYSATGKFWLAIFGKTTISPEDQKLLYMEWPVNGVEVLTNENDYVKTHVWKLNFEASERYPQTRLNKEIFHSGNSSYILDSITQFGPTIEKKYSEITEKYYAWIRVTVWVYPTSDVKLNPTYIAATFNHKGESYKWKAVGTDNLNVDTGKWSQITFDYLTPEAVRSTNDHLSVFAWNKSKGKIFIDDLQVEVFEPKADP